MKNKKLIELYNLGLNDSEIGGKLNMSSKLVWYIRNKLGLKSNFSYKHHRTIDYELLKQLISENKSDNEIAKIMNVSAMGIYNARTRNNIYRKSLSKNKTINISKEQLELLTGCLLGDGSLRLTKDAINPSFSCMHGIKQKEYCLWKYDKLLSCGVKYSEHIRNKVHPKTGNIYKDCTIRIGNRTNFKKLYNNLYKNGKKVITEEFLKNFSELSLAVMYMDDGSKTKHSITIATNCFSIEDLQLFIKFCEDKWGISFNIHKYNKIYLPVKYYKTFIKLVKSYMPESMLYKIHAVT